MKAKLLYILACLLCLGLVACKKDDTIKINPSRTSISQVPAEGGSYEIKVQSGGSWVVREHDQAWIKIAQSGSGANQYLTIEVESNLSEAARTGQIELLSRNSKRMITISQQGKPAGQELKYRVPLVFHVLYYHHQDPNQNIASERIYKVLKEVNELYAKNNINLEFYAAGIDPSGNAMAEPGIDRIKWVAPEINPIEVMTEENNQYLHLLWDPNKYVNVMLYPFSIDAILGIATFPLTPEQFPLEGLDPVKFANLQFSDLKRLRGVSINSSWFVDDVQDPFGGYISSDLLKRQVSTATTIAHELGHYLGLRHVFSEGPQGSCVDTDFCSDTPSYDKRTNYDPFVQAMMSEAKYNPNFKNEFKWQSLFERETCDGKKFEARNIMDYAYCYLDTFTPQQKARMRHTLTYSPFIPGPKHSALSTIRQVHLGPVSIPHNVVICRAPEGYPMPNK